MKETVIEVKFRDGENTEYTVQDTDKIAEIISCLQSETYEPAEASFDGGYEIALVTEEGEIELFLADNYISYCGETLELDGTEVYSSGQWLCLKDQKIASTIREIMGVHE